MDSASIALLIACIGSAAMLGIDLFGLLVITPSLKKVDDGVLTFAMGSIHDEANRAMPILSIVSVLGCVAGLYFGAPSIPAGVGLGGLLAWLVLLGTQVIPINNQLRDAHKAKKIPGNVRQLQQKWDRLLWPRLALLATAIGGLIFALNIGASGVIA